VKTYNYDDIPDVEHKDLRCSTTQPEMPSVEEMALTRTLNAHCARYGFLSAEEAVFEWIEQLVTGAAAHFCERAEKLQKAISK
jgi:hypothetical protein